VKKFQFNTRVHLLGHSWVAEVFATQMSALFDHEVEIDTVSLVSMFDTEQDNVAHPLAFQIVVEVWNLPADVLQSVQFRAEYEADRKPSRSNDDSLFELVAGICRQAH